MFGQAQKTLISSGEITLMSKFMNYNNKTQYITDMNSILKFLAAACLAFALCCCSGNNSGNTKTDSDEFDDMFEKVVTEKSQDKSNAIINKAFGEGRISGAQEKYLKAMVVFKDFEHFDSVITMCQPLVEQPEVKADKKLLYRIYALMANAAEGCGSYGDMIQYASKTESLAKELGKIDKEQEMAGTVGYGMVLLGRGKDGMQMIDNGLHTLAPLTDWNCKNSYIILSKIKIAALDEMDDFGNIMPVCQDLMTRLDDMASHPEKITNMPEEWKTNSKAFSQAIDFYRSQTLAYMTYSYAKTGQDDKARQALKEFDKTAFSKSLDAKRTIVEALGELELYDRMLATYDEIDKNSGGDTISHAYSEELQFRAKAASAVGDYASARRYLRRTIALNDSLHKRIDQEQMARMLSVYKVHEERIKASEASSRARVLLIIIVALAVIVVVTVSLAIRILKQNREMKAKNKTMVGIIDRANKYQEVYVNQLQQNDEKRDETGKNEAKGQYVAPQAKEVAETEDNEDRHIFLEIEQYLREKKMYLECDFQRQTLIDELHIDRNKIGRLIREYSGFPNLSAYINSFRLQHACKLLAETDSRTTIDSIAKQSGFTTVRTFQRLFKELYGMTPAEFREAKQR